MGEVPVPGKVKVPDTSVYVLYPSNGNMHVGLHKTLGDIERFDRQHGWTNYQGEIWQFSGVNISKARNTLCQKFLDETDAEWAWFVDTDMVLQPDTLTRLLCAAEVTGAKVMGALCVMINGTEGPMPTIFQPGNISNNEVTRQQSDYEDDVIAQVAATGTGCLMVHRDVLQTMRDSHPDNPYPWFIESVINTQWVSEDLTFCLRAGDAGFPVYVDCTTPVGHAKGSVTYWPKHIKEKKGFPPPKNYVIIPVKNRLDLTSELVNELRRQGDYERIIICDNGSGKKTRNWLSSQDDLQVFDMPEAGIHEMWNAGIDWALQHADQRRNVNLVFLNNDLELGDKFLARLTEAMRSDDHLVATSANYDERTFDGLVQPVTDICANRYDGTGGFAGFAFGIPGEWLQSGYRFPTECKWWYGDNDLVLVAQTLGHKVGIAKYATVVHVDGGSQTGGDWSDKSEQLAADREAFEAKWRKVAESDDEAA